MRYVLTGLLVLFVAVPVFGQTLEEASDLVNQGLYEEAVAVLEPLAEAGNAEAQNNLGVLYENGLGVEQDTGAALRYYGRADRHDNSSISKLAKKNRRDLIYRAHREQL